MRVRGRRRLLLAALLLGLAGVGYWGWVPDRIDAARCRLGANAAWIGVEWVLQPVADAQVSDLAVRAREQRLRYLFPFTASLRPDGSFSPTFGSAAAFVRQFRRVNRETALLAWVGIPAENTDLASPQSRAAIVAFLARLLREDGFDGVQLDVEPLASGDAHYLQLLDELRVAIGPARLIGVAALPWRSAPEARLSLAQGYRWDGDYYRQVAERADQLAVMAYDSAAPTAALYRLWMREQTRGLLGSLAGSRAELLIGISLSRESTGSHHPGAENLRSGLAGLCAGLAGAPGAERVRGVALYPEWEASADDWQLWAQWQAGAAR